jgi:hypothetical protein
MFSCSNTLVADILPDDFTSVKKYRATVISQHLSKQILNREEKYETLRIVETLPDDLQRFIRGKFKYVQFAMLLSQ